MKINTHPEIDQGLCGTPVMVVEGTSRVELVLSESMAADASGLVHGGFIFGMADYAAMIAVNHPNVVLGAAEVRFLKPVRVGETVTAEAVVTENNGKKQSVTVSVAREDTPVFEGTFTCFVLDKHILS